MRKKLAIIGSGISGLSAAYALKDQYDVTLYEKNHRFGGHSRTIEIHPVGLSAPITVDTGFIVLNDRTYPHLNQLFDELGVERVPTEMTFSVCTFPSGLEWAGTSLNTLFAQRKNLFNWPMLKGIWDILVFNRHCQKWVENMPHLTLGELVAHMRLGSWFQNEYLLPMGGAIWSCCAKKILDFPASTFVHFFRNHGLLNIVNRPQWYTLRHRSIDYVEKLSQRISACSRMLANMTISKIYRTASGVAIEAQDGTSHYDGVLFACHPQKMLHLLTDIRPEEKNILEKFSLQPNHVYTHSDSRYMPASKRCWSSWNYMHTQQAGAHHICVTYWMNQLQHIDPSTPVFVTLNPHVPIDPGLVYDVHAFEHPLYNQAALEGQAQIKELQGQNRLWFCGAYLRYGFHEDGIWSAHQVIPRIQSIL